MSKSCKQCRWVIATILDDSQVEGAFMQTIPLVHEQIICMPHYIEPSQVAVAVCHEWQREAGADSYTDVYGGEEYDSNP